MSIAGSVSRRALLVDHCSGPSWFAAGGLFVLCILSALAAGFTFDVIELAPIFGIISLFFGCSYRLRQLGHERTADALLITGLFYLIACLAALACSLLTATALPYVDEKLAAADRALGFDWLSMHGWFRTAAIGSQLLIGAYGALNLAPQILILLLCALRTREEAYAFLTAWVIALMLTVAIYPLFPAIAAFHHYGLTPDMMPGQTAEASWQLPEIMNGLRTGQDRLIGSAELTGIVTMPSWTPRKTRGA